MIWQNNSGEGNKMYLAYAIKCYKHARKNKDLTQNCLLLTMIYDSYTPSKCYMCDYNINDYCYAEFLNHMGAK